MEHSDQWIDDYLMGRLGKEDLEKFSAHLEKDSSFSKEVAQRKKVLGLVDAFGDLEMMEQIGQVHQKEMAIKNKTRSLKTYLYAAAAIVLAIGICFWLWSKSNSPEQLFAAHYTAYELSFTARNTEKQDLLTQANALYQSGNFREAMPLFEEVFSTDTTASKIGLAIAICKMETGNYPAALSYFSELKNKEFDLYRDHALWYAALIQLKSGNLPAAKENLQQLTERPGAHFYQQAKNLLPQI